MENLKIGDVYLEKVLSEPFEATKDIKEIDRLISEIKSSGNILKSEEKSLNLLCQQRALLTYPELNLEFLGMSNIKEFKDNRYPDTKQGIQMPKFSVYPLYGENKFYIDFRLENLGDVFSRPKGLVSMSVKSPFAEKILKSLEFSKYPSAGKGYGRDAFDIPRELAKKYNRCLGYGNTRLESQINLIIPKETKERVRDAKNIFDKNMCIISETKPEDWGISKIIYDPLIVGTLNNKCFLIDKFNSTPLENYVEKEWLKDNKIQE
jgi:hypothetical protein